MSEKQRFDGRFVPYRNPKSPIDPPSDPDRADFVRVAAEELMRVVLAMDIYPEKGAITVRDSVGNIFEISVQRSDAQRLRCEGEGD